MARRWLRRPRPLRATPDAARRAPVTVTKKGWPAGIVMSIENYERMRAAVRNRLCETMATVPGTSHLHACHAVEEGRLPDLPPSSRRLAAG